MNLHLRPNGGWPPCYTVMGRTTMQIQTNVFRGIVWRPILFASLTLAFGTQPALRAQHFSPVFNTIASYSPNSRPKLFGELQDTLPNFLASVEPGVRLSYMDEQFAILEGKLYNWVNELSASLEAGDLTISYPQGQSIQIQHSLKEFQVHLASFISTLQIFPKDQAPSNQVLQTLFWRLLKHTDLPILRDAASKFKGSSSLTADSLAAAFISYLDTQISNLQDTANLNQAFVRLKEKVIEALHVAQSEIANVVAKASEYFVAGDIGVAFTSGQGALGGGAQIGFKVKKWLLIGGYANLNTSSVHDSEQAGKGLIGLRAILTWSNSQIDLLGSSYFGNHSNHKDFDSYEFGIGYSHRFGESLLIGFALSSLLYDNAQPNYWSAGISLNGVSPYLPWIVAGIGIPEGGRREDIDPIFRIIQPIGSL